ncbi:Sodium/hydrogen exchanger 7 [Folsomia candida]|uniref:Sodium/hydrogen exchanger 7 n=1 Tax=Folsomia candida TaxID=158441 RepID=A0A226E061_FOLCA|nr:Sodium/hydrogen exchanger 7 [Folsomia candida]
MSLKYNIPQCYIIFFAAVIFLVDKVHAGDDKPTAAREGYEHDELKEFVDFCERQIELRNDPESIKRDCKRIHEKDFRDDDLRMLFSLFVIILWGALTRTLLRVLKLNIPYTVVLMFSGIVVGVIARYYCPTWYTFTAIARIKPEIILFAFLPVLIFETAFGISSHVFIKASMQILILAFPGMLIATALTAMLCYQFFSEYKWTFLQACFYGSIISATDPVAVVGILKEVGVSESLSVIVDGESLLNDGVAILLFEIFQDRLKEDEELSSGQLAGNVIIMFLRIAVGGPIFGYIAAKIAIFCLARIFNDAIVEITITLVSAYLTYYIAEDVLGVSGVCAVVLLGITMSSEKTCISPDILEEVHEFWEMAAHLANTVLFFVTGIVISERGSRDLTAVDVYYLILFYFALNFISFIYTKVFNVDRLEPVTESLWVWNYLAKFDRHDVGWVTWRNRNLPVIASL